MGIPGSAPRAMVFTWRIWLSNAMSVPQYAELHCLSNFSFLRGASHPEELVNRAIELGYHSLAITDECSLAGVVRAHGVAKQSSLKLIVGAEFELVDGLRFVLLTTNRHSYGRLSKLITVARTNSEKGSYKLSRQDVEHHFPEGCLALWLVGNASNQEEGQWLKHLFKSDLWLAVEQHYLQVDKILFQHCHYLSELLGIAMVATGNVHMHCRSRRVLQDTLTSIRLNTPLSELGFTLFANGERHCRSREVLANIYPEVLLQESIVVAERCHFSLDELRYEYPREVVPTGHSPQSWLRRLTEEGAARHWPEGVPEKVQSTIEYELALIADLRYEPYFLTVYDLVRYARSQNILCQGRGSAANSAVCYCLGVTAVDPSRMTLLMERFISRERNEPPDIDIDFEHERREEVIQYIYKRYGRDRTALTCSVITYRRRSAIRDVAKALGMRLDQIEKMTELLHWRDKPEQLAQRMREAGFDLDNLKIRQLLFLVKEIMGFPRHLSQHVGGFVIARDDLASLVPIENCAMPDRSVIQWDKNDLETLGLIKVDVLALGMLTAIRKCFDLIKAYSGRDWALGSVPAEDPATYAMIQQADTVGVFQIESRAQMSMLPRLRPKNYYDLVVEIAIVRPGPIQGDMVHPYLQRRNNPKLVDYPSPELKTVLERTLGVPIFQEQVMQIAMVAAGFTAGEADQLRRAMAAWQRKGNIGEFEDKLKQGMKTKGYDDAFAERIFNQIKGFGDYGFPESHSASFALLAYVSSWLKCHEPAAFTCALLNSQPMGFYRPAQLIHDAQRHGVEVHPVDVRFSDWDSTLECGQQIDNKNSQPAIRIGLRQIKGVRKEAALKIIEQRKKYTFKSVNQLVLKCGLTREDLMALAAADALQGLSGHRHMTHWQVWGVEKPQPLLGQPIIQEATPMLRAPSIQENIINDYATIGHSLRAHPMSLIREQLAQQGVVTSQGLWGIENDSVITTAGIVVGRQSPGTASGVMFMTLEDEHGLANLVIWPKIMERYRSLLLTSNLLMVRGKVQQADGVLHVISRSFEDISTRLANLDTRSRDFH